MVSFGKSLFYVLMIMYFILANYFLLAQVCYFTLPLLSSSVPLKTEEYCHSDVFAPRCDRHQILVIENAIYGRKKFGRCLLDEEDPSEGNHGDPRFIGCYSDVKSLILPKCFGKRECDLRIAEIKISTSCYKYLKLYLEVSYSCITVAQPNNLCTMSASQERQYLFGPQKSCGSQSHPWLIETLAGQRLSLSGITFISNRSSISESSSCKIYGQVLDKSSGNSKTPICLRIDQQETQIYNSRSNQVEVYFIEDTSKDIGNFLISIEATGCSDLIPPADAWLKRTENEATIGCYSTRLRWQLKCQGQRWVGVIGNCSYGHSMEHVTEVENREVKQADQKLAAIFMIVVVGFVLCLLIGCVGVVCLKRYYALNKLKSLKQMNGFMNANQHLYNAESMLPAKFAVDSNELGSSKIDLPQNGTLINIDSTQYFELDQSLVAKEVVSK